MKLYLFQVIVASPTFHNSRWIAAEDKNEARSIVEPTLKDDEKVEFVRKVEKAIGKNKEYKVKISSRSGF